MPDVTETGLREAELATELRDYFRATNSTRRPSERHTIEPRAIARHRRHIGELAAAFGLALVLGFGLWSASRAVDHGRSERTSPTAAGNAVVAAPASAQLLFERLGSRTGSPTEIWAVPVAGGTPRLIDTFASGPSSPPVGLRLVAAGRRFVVTSDGDHRISVADLTGRTSRVLDIGRVTSGALDPSQTRLAIHVFHGLGLVDLDILNLADMTVTRLRQMPLNAAMSPYRWLSDGIHAADEDFSTGSTRVLGTYLLDPGSGGITSSLPSADHGVYSQDGRVEAIIHINAAGLPVAISVSVAGSTPQTVYSAAGGRDASIIAVSDDGSLLISDELANTPPVATYPQIVPTIMLITKGAHISLDSGGTLLDGAVALPGHDFVIQVKTAAGTELRRVPPAGPTTVISTLPADFGQLMGIVS